MTVASVLPFDPVAATPPPTVPSRHTDPSDFDRHLDRALGDSEPSRPASPPAEAPHHRTTPHAHPTTTRRPVGPTERRAEGSAAIDDSDRPTETGAETAEDTPVSAAAMASSMVSVPAPLPDAEVMSGATLEPVTDGEMAVGAVTGVASGFQAAPTVPVVDGGGAATMSPVPTTAPGEVTAPTVSDPAPPPLTPTPEPLLVSDVVGAQQPGSVEPADTIAPTRTTDPGPAATADVGTDGAAGTGAPTVPVDPASVQQVPGAGLAADQVVRPGVAPGAVASEDSGSPAPTTAATVEAVAASTTSSSRPASTTTATQSVSTLPPPGAAPLPGTFADLARDIDGAAVVSNPLELRPSGGTHRGAAGLPVSVPSLSMDLSDEGLGPLTLQALNGAGVVHLKLTAGDRAVGDMLSRAGAELRRDLEATGTTVGTLDIGHAGSQSLGSGGPFARDPGSSDDGRTAAVPSLRGTVAHVPASQHPTVTNRAATVTDGLDLRI